MEKEKKKNDYENIIQNIALIVFIAVTEITLFAIVLKLSSGDNISPYCILIEVVLIPFVISIVYKKDTATYNLTTEKINIGKLIASIITVVVVYIIGLNIVITFIHFYSEGSFVLNALIRMVFQITFLYGTIKIREGLIKSDNKRDVMLYGIMGLVLLVMSFELLFIAIGALESSIDYSEDIWLNSNIYITIIIQYIIILMINEIRKINNSHLITIEAIIILVLLILILKIPIMESNSLSISSTTTELTIIDIMDI